MLGKVYTVRGFDKYGNVELQTETAKYRLGRAAISETSAVSVSQRVLRIDDAARLADGNGL